MVVHGSLFQKSDQFGGPWIPVSLFKNSDQNGGPWIPITWSMDHGSLGELYFNYLH